MAETSSNVELAHRIHEEGHHHGGPSADRRLRWVQIAEAVVLAVVAVATSWSGYQAAKWDALSTQHYGTATMLNVTAAEKQTQAGQDRLYDITNFNAWVDAKLAGHDKLAAFYQRRFRPEYATAFAAWWKLDPVNNLSAPAGPIFMPEYKDSNNRESAKLAQEAAGHFREGVTYRETGDNYVRVTVLLATVLLLTALGQRFELLGARVTVVAIAFLLALTSTYWILSYPRA